jgi:electron transfer flavoprotein alpha subunit
MRTTNHKLYSGVISASIACATILWSPAGICADAPGSKPGDENMTCEQIAAELQPYMQEMLPSVMAMGQTAQEAKTRGEERVAKAAPEAAAESAEASATLLDPTGMSSKILGQAQAKRQKERWKQAEAEDKPLNEKYKTQSEQVLKEGQQLQSNERIQRLMQLAQEKNCH